MDEDNARKLARELLVALRGRRSQVQWSRRLGYRSNVAYAWESGRRQPSASEWFRALERGGIDVTAGLERFYGRRPAWLDGLAGGVLDPEAPAALLRDLWGRSNLSELSRRAGISRYSVSRWCTAQTEPRLPDFLRILDAASLRLPDLVATWVDPAELPSLAARWRALEARRAAADHPWTQAVLRALELGDYLALGEHADGWIAARLGISPDLERECLSVLVGSGQVAWVDGRWRPQALVVDTSTIPEVGRRLRAHWATVGRDRAEGGAPGQYSYNVFGVSRAGFEQIRELHLQYFRALRAIAAESEPNEVVAVANVQLFALEP